MLTLLALFYFPPFFFFPPAALPSGHSLELLTETGYVASPEKDKTDPYDRRQTENTFPNNSARASLWASTQRAREKTKSHSEKKKKKTHQIPFFFFHGLFFSVIVFSERLWLSPSHSFLAWGYPTAARWLRNSKHFSPWAGRAGLKRKGAAGVREEMFPGSCCGTTGATGTELLTARGEGRCCSHLKTKLKFLLPIISPHAPQCPLRLYLRSHAVTQTLGTQKPITKVVVFFATTNVIGLKKSTQSGIYSNPWAEQTHHCKSHIFGGWTKKNLSYARNNSCLWAGDGSVLVHNVNIQISEQLQGTTQRQ